MSRTRKALFGTFDPKLAGAPPGVWIALSIGSGLAATGIYEIGKYLYTHRNDPVTFSTRKITSKSS